MLRRSLLLKLLRTRVKTEHYFSTLKPTIGLEVHAQIRSNSKLFSRADAQSGIQASNSIVNLFDTAYPGTLPVINRRCVEAAIMTAHALNCQIHAKSQFDRKHYFYADLPAGYQITQKWHRLATCGHLVLDNPKKTIRIDGIQLEQDSGQTINTDSECLINLNRVGTALLEIITMPDFHSATEVLSFLTSLKLILRHIGVFNEHSEGAMRVDVNISMSNDRNLLGQRTEVKNMISFVNIRHAIESEIDRQTKILSSCGIVDAITLGFDEDNMTVFPTRKKEGLADYRFMPDPNLPPLVLCRDTIPSDDTVNIDEMRRQLPELPDDRRRRYAIEYNLNSSQIDDILPDLTLCAIVDAVMSSAGTRTNEEKVAFGWFVVKTVGGLLYRFPHCQGVQHASDQRLCIPAIVKGVSFWWDHRLSSEGLQALVEYVFESFELLSSREGIAEDFIARNDLWLVDDKGLLTRHCEAYVGENETLKAVFKKTVRKHGADSKEVRKLVGVHTQKILALASNVNLDPKKLAQRLRSALEV